MFRKLTTLLLVLMLTTAASAQVMLNEFYYDNPGTEDATVKFIEIYGPPGTNLTGYSLVGINANGGIILFNVALTGSIPSDGYYVVGGANALNVDQQANVELENAGYGAENKCDGVQLRNGATIVDHVCYGTCATGEVCIGEGGTNAPDYDPPSGGPAKSLARFPNDHQDTDDNAADWQFIDPMTPGMPNSGTPCAPWETTLTPLRQNDANGVPVYLDTFVVVRAIANVDNFVLDSISRTRFYIQDDDAGINMYGGNVPTNIVAGDCLTVSAWVYFWEGITELVSGGPGNCFYSVIRTTHVDPPEPTLITCSTPFEGKEGMLVRIDNVHIVDGNWPVEGQYGNLTIADANGTVGLNIVKWTNIDGTPPPTPTFHVIGIMTQYDPSSPFNTGYQITPRSTSDIINITAAGDPVVAAMAEEFTLTGSYPNPFNSTAQIRFTVGSARELTLTIIDVLGREVAREKLTGLTPGAHSYTWSPSGATGVYLLRLSGASRIETAKLLYLK